MVEMEILGLILQRLTSIEETLSIQPGAIATAAGSSPIAANPPILLDDALIDSFLSWSKTEQHNSDRWIKTQRRLLSWWKEQLGGADLRRLSLQKILPALDQAPGSRGHRIAVLKCVYSWLRTERHQIGPEEDPTFGVLKVPQASPAQNRYSRAIPRSQYLAVRKKLKQRPRAALDVLAGTGWHVSELERFIKTGSVDRRRQVLICPRSKRGGLLRTRVTKKIIDAAMLLRRNPRWSEKHFRTEISKACADADLPLLRPGSMRHSVATYAIDAGEPLDAVSDFLNHLSSSTTKRFYSTHAVPRKVKTLAG